MSTFRVPAANTDGTTPADLSRVDVYALTVRRTCDRRTMCRRAASR